MARQIDRKHRAPVMGEIARLKAPDGMIHTGAMDQHGQRQTAVKSLPAGGGEHGVA